MTGERGLVLDQVSVRYGDLLAVREVSLQLPTGETLAVLGPSGCGKSTLLRVIAGLEPIGSGTIAYDGQQVHTLPTHRRGFAMMFQDGQLFDHLTVGANVAYPLRLRRRPSAERQARVAELLDLVGLSGYGARMPGTLSGGERQRVALARALAVQPRVILLDEPLSALDASLRDRLAADLREILVAANTTALLVTHDHQEAFGLADQIAVMRAGAVVQSGRPTQVWAHPADAETALFLGYARVLRGEAARRILSLVAIDSPSSEPEVALRRSALVVGGGDLRGIVLSAQATPEQWRVSVDVEGLGVVDAVARLDSSAAPTPGEQVHLSADAARLAVIGSGGPAGPST